MADEIWPEPPAPPPAYVPPLPEPMYFIRRRADGLWYDNRTYGRWRENPADCMPFKSKRSALQNMSPYAPREVVCDCGFAERRRTQHYRQVRHKRRCATKVWVREQFNELYELVPLTEIMRYAHAVEPAAQPYNRAEV